MSICFNSKALVQAKSHYDILLKKSGSAFYLVIALTLSLISTGCQSVMSTPSSDSGFTKAPNVFPLTFKVHNFEAYCYNTVRCRVIYNNFNFTLGGEAESPSGPPPSPDYKKNWNASYVGIRNFPPPADVRWTSLDGTIHEARIDIGEIFKDERVLHNVPESDYAQGTFDGSADIFLEVNDRTINVYMEAFVATKNEQIPGNKYSYGRTDLILAWSHTY
jgi:hypothetical protein